MKSTITFHGGAGSVTGANFLLDAGSTKILVDCGSEASEHVCDPVSNHPFVYDVHSIDTLLVTHAHADHIGRIPQLVRNGFRGTIISTDATRDISAIMFEDALGIMQREALERGCEVLYEKEDVETALSLWVRKSYHETFQIADIAVEFLDAGHILGSALIRMQRNGRTILFTGDLGNTPEPLLRETESPEGAHYLVMESVYGDRIHEARSDRSAHFREALEATRARNGVLLIPSFSVERTQVLLYEINRMVEDGNMEPLTIYLDSPLASRVTPVFRTYSQYFNSEVQSRINAGDDIFAFPGLTIVHSTRESREIHKTDNPKVIIAGAGMSAGGRIRSHELEYLSDPKATVLFVGYQAAGTLGRRLQEGASKVRIDDEWVRVHARVETLTGYSGHADREQLLDFVERTGESLEKVFVAMGEPKASLFLGQRIKDFLGIEAIVPKKDESSEIEF
jgi:metallo-beta-lactamase family protein